MTWIAFHHRGDVLRAVTDDADLRRDGTLPTHLPGVAETFDDELDLVGALQLRWFTRLSGAIERSLTSQPTDLDAAVRDAWVRTAEELPGIRAIVDHHVAEPGSAEMAEALDRAMAKECLLLATMAGRSGSLGQPVHERALEAGRRLREQARASYDVRAGGPARAPKQARPTPTGSAAFVERLKAALAAA